MPKDRVRWCAELGAIVSDIPGEGRWAEGLLREAISLGADARSYVLLAVVIEDERPKEAATYLARARKMWRGDPRELDQYLPGLRARGRVLKDLEASE